jgi:hypothetical protein
MAEPSLESTMDLTTKVNKIGFVEFTTDLVSNVYNVIVQASMDQLKSFADLVKDVSKSVGDYQTSLDLGYQPNTTTPTPELTKNCENYATQVLGLILTTTTTPSYQIDGADLAAVKDKRIAVIADLQGFDANPTSTTAGTIDQTLPSETTITKPSQPITKADLDAIIALKLRKGAEDNYNLLVTILKLGMQKVVVDKGLIATKLTFHVDATQTESKASSDVNIKSKNFNVSGTASVRGRRFGASVSGGYSSTSLSVSVVNEKSSAVANLAVDIVGEVRIEFRTDSFPSFTAS